jgi:hypothetical protein
MLSHSCSFAAILARRLVSRISRCVSTKMYMNDNMIRSCSMAVSIMPINRANDPEQKNRAEHGADNYRSSVSREGINDCCQQLAEQFTAKNQNQKRANEQRGDHVIYSLRAILKPLLGNVNCEVIL